MELIALEEGFWYDALKSGGTPLDFVPVRPEVMAGWRRRLTDFTEFRLPEMDEHGVRMQVPSLTAPGIRMQPDPAVAVADARLANDFLATVIGQHPTRFRGLAAIPLQDPNPVPAAQWTVLQGYPGLDHATWGWNQWTAGHALRLIFGGVFDRFPRARLILGHMGEFLPAQLCRIDLRYRDLDPRAQRPLEKLPSRSPRSGWTP